MSYSQDIYFYITLTLTIFLQDRVCTDANVLGEDPLNLDPQTTREQLVWGIDCSCRRLVEVAIIEKVGEAAAGGKSGSVLAKFIQYRLLPAINAQPAEAAHSMLAVTEYMLAQPTEEQQPEGEQGMGNATYTPLEHQFVLALRESVQMLGQDMFRIHPKGTGVVCVRPEGISAHQLVCEYLGEMYPPYRWCERQDIVQQVSFLKSLPFSGRLA